MTSLPDYYRCDKFPFSERFKKDVANHGLTIIKDDGLYRHLRFSRSGSSTMLFDILTWPGCLCFTGDMGTYVFRRLPDMLNFFRKSPESNIDFRYWAEKVESEDKTDHIREWCPDTFKFKVLELYRDLTSDCTPEDRGQVMNDLQSEILDYLQDEPKEVLLDRLYNFSTILTPLDSEEISDIASASMVYSFRFLWCCHALVWGISCYDNVVNPPKNPQEDQPNGTKH